jgi:hypothetical protein
MSTQGPHSRLRHASAWVVHQFTHASVFYKWGSVKIHTLSSVNGSQGADNGQKSIYRPRHQYKNLSLFLICDSTTELFRHPPQEATPVLCPGRADGVLFFSISVMPTVVLLVGQEPSPGTTGKVRLDGTRVEAVSSDQVCEPLLRMCKSESLTWRHHLHLKYYRPKNFFWCFIKKSLNICRFTILLFSIPVFSKNSELYALP